MKEQRFKIITIVSVAIILAIVLALNVAVGIFSPLLDKFVVGYQEGESSGAARAEGVALSEQIQAEGTVLVQNNDNVLPLSKDDAPRVNVFGWAVTDWVISGSGTGQVKRAGAVDLLEALEEYGIE